MRTIWKFPVLSTGPCEIEVPEPGMMVHVGRDPLTGLVAFWAEVESDAPKVARRFLVVGTGHPIPADAAHRGSVVNGDFVWHLLELPEAERP